MAKATVDKTEKTRAEMVKKMAKKITKLPFDNIVIPHLAGDDKGKPLFVAKLEICSIAQNLITSIDDHKYLRKANILMMIEMDVKPDVDGMLKLGQVKLASHLDRTLLTRKDETRPDFIMILNGDEIDSHTDDAAVATLVAVIDHELSHCAPVIAGRYVKFEAIEKLLFDLGNDYIDQPDGELDDKGRQLVRYLKRDGGVPLGEEGYHAQPFKWRTRKHELTEFHNVVGRWGMRCGGVQKLCDVMEKAIDHDGQMELFEGEKESKTAAA